MILNTQLKSLNQSEKLPLNNQIRSDELNIYQTNVPNYITFNFSRLNGYKCKNKFDFNLSFLKTLLVGNSPPREGHQLMITLQSIPTRLSTNYFPLTNLLRNQISNELDTLNRNFDSYKLYHSSKFIFDNNKNLYLRDIEPSVLERNLYKKYSPEELLNSRAKTIIGIKTPWNHENDLYSVLTGYNFTLHSIISGPKAQNSIFNHSFRKIIEDHPILLYAFLENLLINSTFHFSPSINMKMNPYHNFVIEIPCKSKFT